jgi:hypothetical protein
VIVFLDDAKNVEKSERRPLAIGRKIGENNKI